MKKTIEIVKMFSDLWQLIPTLAALMITYSGRLATYIQNIIFTFWQLWFVVSITLAFIVIRSLYKKYKYFNEYIKIFPRWDGIDIYKIEGIGKTSIYFKVINLSDFQVDKPKGTLKYNNFVTLNGITIIPENKTESTLRFEGELSNEQYNKLLELAKRRDRITISGDITFPTPVRNIEKTLYFEAVFVSAPPQDLN